MGAALRPAPLALLLQLAAAVLVLPLAWWLNWSLWLTVASIGVLAAVMSWRMQQARWWWLIHLLFAPSALLLLSAQLPAWLFLLVFILLLLVYWSTFRTQVPLYLSSKQVWQALEHYLPKQHGFRFVDLGSGLGGVLHYLVSQRTDGVYIGLESAPLPYCYSALRLLRYPQCRVKWGDFWQHDLSQYDVVFAYLSPVPMPELWQKARREMRPGSVFISSTFAVPGQLPDETVQLHDLHHATLLIWRM